MRKDEHGLLLDPDVDVDGDLLGTRLPRRTNLAFPPGRGYFVVRGDVELVQVAAG
jgi:S-DNA-T family DNA segregation ATPase FtsK/SpoIIIE